MLERRLSIHSKQTDGRELGGREHGADCQSGRKDGKISYRVAQSLIACLVGFEAVDVREESHARNCNFSILRTCNIVIYKEALSISISATGKHTGLERHVLPLHLARNHVRHVHGALRLPP